MATKTVGNVTKFQSSMQKLADGLTTNTSGNLATISLLGTAMTRAEVISKLKAFLLLYSAVTQTKQPYVSAIEARKAAEASAHAFYTAVVAFLKLILGPNNQAQLAAFGIAPPKAKKAPSAETRAIAKVKAQNTRKARGTVGKKQRQAITATPQPTVQVLSAAGQPLASPTTTPPATPSSTVASKP